MQVGGTNLLTGTKTLTGAGLSGQIVEKYKGCNVIYESNNNGKVNINTFREDYTLLYNISHSQVHQTHLQVP